LSDFFCVSEFLFLFIFISVFYTCDRLTVRQFLSTR